MNQYRKYLKKKSLSINTIRTYISVLKVLNITKESRKNQLRIKILSKNKSINTQILYYNVVLEYFKYYKNKSIINYLRLLKIPPKPQQYMKTISKRKITNLLFINDLDTTNAKYWKLILKLLFETGMRSSELSAIIKINKNSIIIKGKGAKIREVFCISKTLLEILKIQKDNFFPYTTKTLRKKIKIFLGEEWTPHSLRRSFATHMLLNGANPKMVQLQLGHSKIETTYNYLHLSYKMNKRIYNKFF